MFARACIAVACIATFARCVAATFACAPAPVVSTRAGVVETIPLGATDAEDEDAPCRANTSATYVVVTLPARGRLLDPRTLAPILAAPHVLPPGVRPRSPRPGERPLSKPSRRLPRYPPPPRALDSSRNRPS